MTSDASDALASADAARGRAGDAPRARRRRTRARDAATDEGERFRRRDARQRCDEQIEFYLGDSNLPRDAFLLDEVSRATREGHDGGGADRAHRVVLEDAGFFGDVRGEG